MGAVAFSPVTDLALTGESYDTRAEADPYFTKSQAAGLVRSYLGETDPKNPLASPLYANLSGLPPIRVHVGDDEVLLDDSRRYVERAVAAGVDAKLDVWMGMPHGFVTNVGGFNAATQALKASGAFLTERLGRRGEMKTSIRTHEGRVALVTGADQGVGQTIALASAKRGARVIDIDLKPLDHAVGGRGDSIMARILRFSKTGPRLPTFARRTAGCERPVSWNGDFLFGCLAHRMNKFVVRLGIVQL